MAPFQRSSPCGAAFCIPNSVPFKKPCFRRRTYASPPTLASSTCIDVMLQVYKGLPSYWSRKRVGFARSLTVAARRRGEPGSRAWERHSGAVGGWRGGRARLVAMGRLLWRRSRRPDIERLRPSVVAPWRPHVERLGPSASATQQLPAAQGWNRWGFSARR